MIKVEDKYDVIQRQKTGKISKKYRTFILSSPFSTSMKESEPFLQRLEIGLEKTYLFS
mgnify:CR=1 FL=1